MKIKKINTLDQLNALKEGSLVETNNVSEKNRSYQIYEGVNEGIYSFFDFNTVRPDICPMTAWEVKKENIDLSRKNGVIAISPHNSRAYVPKSEEHNKRLKMITEALN